MGACSPRQVQRSGSIGNSLSTLQRAECWYSDLTRVMGMMVALAAVSVHWRVCDAVLYGAPVSDLKAYHVSVCAGCGSARVLHIHACCE